MCERGTKGPLQMATDRADASVLAVVLLVGATALGAVTVAAALPDGPPDMPARALLSLSVDPGTDRIAIRHEGGDALEPAAVGLHVTVDGDPIAHQPPVPFFAATGFISGPTGPFNSATKGEWTAGEVGSLRLASTNTEIPLGGTVRVRVSVRGRTVAALTTTA